MDPHRWSTVCAIFHDALEQPEETRDTFLRSACGGDPELIGDVSSLLANYAPANRFLEQPATLVAADVLGFEGAGDLLPGRLFAGRYRIEEEIGRGGFGVVYRATDRRLHGKPVAVKVLHEYWGTSGWMRHRFEEEAKALARLRDPAIVSVSDFGETEDSRMFLVMEWLQGPTLRDLLARGPVERRQAAEILGAIGSALEAAHSAGLLHRDLKPENVIVGQPIKIVDFGVARVGEVRPEGGATTIIAGTPQYMAPEQVMGRPCRASDIYSLALIARELCTGGTPAAPRRVLSLIQEGLRQDPAQRPQSAQAYANALAAELLRPQRLAHAIGRRTVVAGGATACSALALWEVRRYFFPPGLPPRDRIVESPGDYPETQYGFHAAYDIQSVIVTNEDNTGRDRRRIWTSDIGEYCHPLTKHQKEQAWRKGFRLSVQLLPEEGIITVVADLAGFGPRFDLIALRGANGETLAGTVKQVTPIHRFDLYPSPNRAPRLTTIELVLNSVTKLARVSVDGKLVAADYAGHHQFQEDRGLVIAVGKNQSNRASGIYKYARIEIFG